MATETLRPNAEGDETAITDQYPGEGEHWDKVDEVTSDEDTYVYEYDDYWVRDLYNLPASSVGAGTINNVTVYMRAWASMSVGVGGAKISIKTAGSTVDGPEVSFANEWTTYTFSKTWLVNPVTGLAWTWAQINALQIGANIVGYQYEDGVFVTTLYVVVDYTAAPPSGWLGTFNELTAPGSAVSVASADLASVNGVTG
jgi:hypothetical protein